MSDDQLDYELTKIQQQTPSKPPAPGQQGDKNNKQKENKKMGKINWKKVLETLKTITIVALIAGVVGFGLGVKYQESKNEQLNNKVISQLQQLKSEK